MEGKMHDFHRALQAAIGAFPLWRGGAGILRFQRAVFRIIIIRLLLQTEPAHRPLSCASNPHRCPLRKLPAT